MQLLFREVRPDEVEQEMTQRDQFDTDEVGLAETTMRETHQNSLDAGANGSAVRTRIVLKDPSAEAEPYWNDLLGPLVPHLNACGIDLSGIDIKRPRLLVIEDFGTVGLTGAWDKKDTGNFSDFWRRVGGSHKGGKQGGRWGLGKLVFSSASKIRALFGVTIRADDAARTPLLMGQAVLKNHRLGPKDYAPHGFFAEEGAGGFQLPVIDPEKVKEFAIAAGVSRTTEPGLSLVVPFPRDDFSIAGLVPYIVRNYFFPILTGQLVVEIGDETVSATTFDALAKKYGGVEHADGRLAHFIREIEAARKAAPAVTLGSNWAKGMERALDEAAVKTLRDCYSEKKLVHVRAPVTLRRKSGTDEVTFFDLFLRMTEPGVRGHALFVRGAITLPGEAQFFPAGQAFGALVASDAAINAFLGDAENPAHTRWNGNADKLSQNWRNASTRLREVRNSLHSLYSVLARAVERLENDALIHLLSIKEAGVKPEIKQPDPVVKPPVVPPIPSKPQRYTITARIGGFAIRGLASSPASSFPLQIRVRAAYDLLRGDPFKRHSPYDFDMTKGEVAISGTAATWNVTASNEMVIDANDATFAVEVKGFDPNRDLLVRAAG